MLEVRVLSLVAVALERLKLHRPRRCETNSDHGEVSPTIGSLELSIVEPDAAVYVCANDRCGWRHDKLRASDATPANVTDRFTVPRERDE
jgi:hypothetical protein